MHILNNPLNVASVLQLMCLLKEKKKNPIHLPALVANYGLQGFCDGECRDVLLLGCIQRDVTLHIAFVAAADAATELPNGPDFIPPTPLELC